MQKLFENWRNYLKEDEKSDADRALELSQRFSTKEKSNKFDITDLDTVFPFLKTWVGRNPSIPLHIRAFTKYLIGPPDPFTEKDLSHEEQQDIGNWLWSIHKSARISQSGIFKIRYGDYRGTATQIKHSEADAYSKFYKEQSSSPVAVGNIHQQIMLFLGQFTVELNNQNSYLRIVDKYDFSLNNKKSGIIEQWWSYFEKGYKWPGWLGIIRQAAPHVGVPYSVDIKLSYKMFPDTWINYINDI